MKFSKKTYLLPQELINKTKKVLKAKTETEAVIRAMESLLFKEELIDWHQKNRGKIKIKDIYA